MRQFIPAGICQRGTSSRELSETPRFMQNRDGKDGWGDPWRQLLERGNAGAAPSIFASVLISISIIIRTASATRSADRRPSSSARTQPAVGRV